MIISKLVLHDKFDCYLTIYENVYELNTEFQSDTINMIIEIFNTQKYLGVRL